jgi:hypothetical protein
MAGPTTRSGRRPESVEARNRGVQGANGGSNLSARYGDCVRGPAETIAQIAGTSDSLALFGGAPARDNDRNATRRCGGRLFEAFLNCREAFYGERRRGRAKPSGDQGQYCGSETARTAS